MQESELIRLYPYLYHVAEAGSWPSIAAHGLLTSEQLCRSYDLDDVQIEQLLRQRRSTKIELSDPRVGSVVLRDQRPLSISKLERCLQDGLSPAEWLQTLNERVFFWLQENRLHRMLAAYADEEHDVLILDTASLVRVHSANVRLSRINSGSTAYMAQPRGTQTFRAIDDYPHPPRRRPAAAASDVAELCVIGGVPDVAAFVLQVERRRGPDLVSTVWQC